MRIAIDLQSILAKKLNNKTSSILSWKPKAGALGSVAVLSDVFDLYLINKYSSLNNESILAWLKLSQSEHVFRQILDFDEKVKDFYVRNAINVTIASDSNIIENVKAASITYWLSDVHTKDIQDQIQKVFSWQDIVRALAKYATAENYEFKYSKK